MPIEANLPRWGFARISTDCGRISAVTALGPERPGELFCTSGFIDTQINGFAGVDFSDQDLTPEAAAGIVPVLARTGTTTFCPTLITNTLERLRRNFRVLEAARSASPEFAAAAPCYHLEGPYLSPGPSHGAHHPEWMRQPSCAEFDSLQEAAGGRIGILTIAPELPGALEVIRHAAKQGVIVSISHTDGTAADAHAAADAGAVMSTHLGNGCPSMIHRHTAPFWGQLADDRLDAALICDGFHLPADVVQVIWRAKTTARCLLVTDAVAVAGLEPGNYEMLGTPIELMPNGCVMRADGGSLAGSALSMDRAVANFRRLTGAPLETAVELATARPAAILRRWQVPGEVVPGARANLILFNWNDVSLDVRCVLLDGNRVFGSPVSSRAAEHGRGA
jgi:N-acetylglucosamine-6-phosphate deacetylase